MNTPTDQLKVLSQLELADKIEREHLEYEHRGIGTVKQPCWRTPDGSLTPRQYVECGFWEIRIKPHPPESAKEQTPDQPAKWEPRFKVGDGVSVRESIGGWHDKIETIDHTNQCYFLSMSGLRWREHQLEPLPTAAPSVQPVEKWAVEKSAFAQGKRIQFKPTKESGWIDHGWEDCHRPGWRHECEYRIHPDDQPTQPVTGSADEQNSGTCSICKWCNTGCLNLGDPGKPQWVCHGCIKREFDPAHRLTLEQEEKIRELAKASNLSVGDYRLEPPWEVFARVKAERDTLRAELDELREAHKQERDGWIARAGKAEAAPQKTTEDLCGEEHVHRTFVQYIEGALTRAGAPTHHPDVGAPARKPMLPQERISWLGAQHASPWISCTSRMPTEEDETDDKYRVVFWTNGRYRTLAHHDAKNVGPKLHSEIDSDGNEIAFHPTHWMPIPPLPQPEPPAQTPAQSGDREAFEKWWHENHDQDAVLHSVQVQNDARLVFKAGADWRAAEQQEARG